MQGIVNLSTPNPSGAPEGHDEAMAKRFDDGAAAAARGESYVAPSDVTPPTKIDPNAAPTVPPTEVPKVDATDAPVDEPKVEPSDDPFDAPLAKAGLSLADVSAEFADGGLSDATYKKLTEAGFPRDLVDLAVAGRQAEVTNYHNTVVGVAGDEAAYGTLISWAAESLTEAEINQFNADVNSYDPARAAMAVKGLQARHTMANPAEPSFVDNRTPTSGTQGFASWAQVKVEMAKPEYKNDPAFRDAVRQRLSVSNI